MITGFIVGFIVGTIFALMVTHGGTKFWMKTTYDLSRELTKLEKER